MGLVSARLHFVYLVFSVLDYYARGVSRHVRCRFCLFGCGRTTAHSFGVLEITYFWPLGSGSWSWLFRQGSCVPLGLHFSGRQLVLRGWHQKIVALCIVRIPLIFCGCEPLLDGNFKGQGSSHVR